LAKTTLIIFYRVWPLIWLVYRLPDRRGPRMRDWLRELEMLAVRKIVGLYVINLGYRFERSFTRLGDYRRSGEGRPSATTTPNSRLRRFHFLEPSCAARGRAVARIALRSSDSSPFVISGWGLKIMTCPLPNLAATIAGVSTIVPC
jgi:hypothetical protein